MAGVEETLEKCSELTLIMGELEREIPALRNSFSECKELYNDFNRQINKNKNVLERSFEECQQNLDKQMKRIAIAIKRYEKEYDKIVGNQDVLEMIRKNAEMQAELQKKILQLEERLEMMEMMAEKPDSLRAIIQKTGNRFPIRVHKEGNKPWTPDYYFEVERVDDTNAYGTSYKGDKIYKPSESRPLDEAPFSIYRNANAGS